MKSSTQRGDPSRMHRSAERVARNDATFREANERIDEAAEREEMTDRIPFICECAEESCTQIVRLSHQEYESVRTESTHFLNAPGHEVAAGPHAEVVERNQRYLVVRKVGAAADIVDELDPRTSRR
jgi:hypothetical protein